MIAEERKSKWADSSSESSDSDRHSSDSDAEEIQCLMADDESTTTSHEVFDFGYDEFTRDELVKTFHDMVEEYSKLSQSFEEVKTKNKSLKDQINNFTCLQ